MKKSRRTIHEFLGKGWTFPVLPSNNTRQIELVEGFENVRKSIWIILETEPGERIMRPDFGCGLRRYLMKPNTPATRAMIRRDVERAVGYWEPRIRLKQVDVSGTDDPALVLIHIHFLHTRDNSPGNLVYPFYLE